MTTSSKNNGYIKYLISSRNKHFKKKIVLIGFSWWYWRLNHLSRIGKGKEAITFDKKPTPFSYFAKTASVVVSDTTEHGVCETDVARAIRILNGFVVLDIFGLTLSRAVGLVIT